MAGKLISKMRRPIGALLKLLFYFILIFTEVGNSEGAVEREAEWERRNDEGGESRLGELSSLNQNSGG